MKGRIVIILCALWGLFPYWGKAQDGNFYFNEVQVQRNNLNPAFVTPYSLSVGIPGVSGINARIENNFLSWDALVVRGADDSLRIDLPRLVGRANRRSRIAANIDEEIIRVGWRHERNNFVVGLSLHADMQMVLGKETLSFLFQGPGAHIGNNELPGNRLDLNSYAYLYFGYSRLINKHLTVGGRFKLLHGLYNFHTKDLKLNFNILNEDMSDPDLVPYQYDLRVNGSFRTNLPIEHSDKGYSLGSLLSIQPFRNMGAALDLGMNYHFDNGLDVSASVLDFGLIAWSDANAAEFKSAKNIKNFKGVDLTKSRESSVMGIVTDMLHEIWDTLGPRRNDSVSGDYVRMLPASINIGLSYTLLDMHRFGVLLRGQFYNKYFAPELAVSYTIMPCKNFAMSVSNTFCSGNILNLGLSLAVNAGPVQLHIGVDRLNSFNAAKMRTASVTFGLNLVFGKSTYDWYTGDVDHGGSGE